MHRLSIVTTSVFAILAGIGFAVTCSQGKVDGGIDTAHAAEAASCDNRSFYMSSAYMEEGCNSKDTACAAPVGWEPISAWYGPGINGASANAVLMRKCLD